MAEREAKVRLNLASAGFLSSLKDLQKAAKEFEGAVADIGEGAAKSSKKASAFGEIWKSSLSAAKNSLSELGGSLKSTLTQAATLGGALGVGAALKQTTELQDRYQQLAFRIERATGSAVEWTQIQSAASEAATRNGRTSAEMADAMEAVWQKTGDKSAALGSLEAIAVAMNATGRSGKELGDIVGVMQKKFGVSGPELTQGLTAVISAADQGGMSLEQMAEDFEEFGSIAKLAGQSGAEGLQRVLGFANAVNKDVANMSETLTGLDQFFEKMRQTTVLEGLGEAGGFKSAIKDVTTTGDAVERLRRVMGRAGEKGKDAFSKFQKQATEGEFTGREEQSAYKKLSEPFTKAYQEALAAGKNSKAATEAGLAAFDASIEAMSKSTSDWTAIQKQSARGLESPQAKLRQAVQEFTKAFEDPRIVQAIRDLAQDMPRLAQAFAGFVKWAAGNPLAGIGAIIAAKVGTDVANAQISEALSKAISGESKKLSLGGIVALTGSFAVGFGVGEAIANAVYDALSGKEDRNRMEGIQSVVGAGRSSPEQIRAEIAKQEAKLQGQKDDLHGLRWGTKGLSIEGATNAFDEAMGGLAWAKGKITGEEVPFETANMRSIRDTEGTIEELKALLARKEAAAGQVSSEAPPPGKLMSSAFDRPADKFSSAADKISRAADRIAEAGGMGSGGNNGLPATPGNSSGSNPWSS